MIGLSFEVVRASDDGLWRYVWRFHLSGYQLTLTRFTEQARTTRRHKWRKLATWGAAHYERLGITERKLEKPRTPPADAVDEIVRDISAELLRRGYEIKGVDQ